MRNKNKSTLEQSKGIWDWQVVYWTTGLAIAGYIAFFTYHGYTEIATREVIRWSARVSFVTFGLAFGANGIHQVLKKSLSFWLLMNRKYLGISFAISHTLHLIALGLLQYQFHPVFTMAKTSSLLAGGIAYLFILLMFITSFEKYAAMLTRKQWKWLHKIGGYWILGIFFSSYFKRALTESHHWIYVGCLLFLLGLRIRVLIKNKIA